MTTQIYEAVLNAAESIQPAQEAINNSLSNAGYTTLSLDSSEWEIFDRNGFVVIRITKHANKS